MRWRARPGDELFSARSLPPGIDRRSAGSAARPVAHRREPHRLVFSPSGMHPPFTVLLALDELRVQVVSDALAICAWKTTPMRLTGMNPRPVAKRSWGFTLIEMLVALAILAISPGCRAARRFRLAG
jgi:prepilin-type N-terminal cleavage/methylation domain-containing protein